MNEQDYINKLIEKNNYKKESAINFAKKVFRPSIKEDDSDREQYKKLKNDNWNIDFQEKLESLFELSEFKMLKSIDKG